MNKRIILLLNIICLWTAFTQSFISHFLLSNKAGQKLLLIGDLHAGDNFKPIMDMHVTGFSELCKQWNGSKQIPCLLELTETLDTDKDEIAHSFKALLSNKTELEKNVSFKYCEQRGTESEIIEAFFAGMRENFAGLESQKFPAEQERFMIQMLWMSLRQRNENHKALDVQSYLAKMEIFKQKMEQIIAENKMSPSDVFSIQASQAYDVLYTKFKQGYARIKDILCGHEKEDVLNILAKQLYTCQTVKQINEKFEQIYSIFCKETDWVIADFFFVHSVLKEQRNNKNQVILIVGQGHTENVIKSLVQAGYVVLKELNALAQANQWSFEIDVPTLKAFLPQLRESMAIFLKEAPCCNVCLKENVKPKCGFCSVVHYCGRECQSKDWPKHKQLSPQCTVKK